MLESIAYGTLIGLNSFILALMWKMQKDISNIRVKVSLNEYRLQKINGD
jgi:hypothetical protein